MRVLHIFDCAAVACTLAKFQRDMGHDAHVISFTKMDPFGFLKFYGEECIRTVDPTEFYLNAIDRAIDYDIIHVHFVWGVIPYLRNKYGNTKKIILHYHGSDIRQFQEDKARIKAENMADYVIGSTIELRNYSDRLTWIPNPIDTDHFRRRVSDFTNPRRLCIISDEEYLIKEHIHRLGLECDFIDRKKSKITYSTMPDLFSQYTSYIDIKYQDGKLLPTDSKTGYEALACGLERIDNDGNSEVGLPYHLDGVNVTRKVVSIYSSLC